MEKTGNNRMVGFKISKSKSGKTTSTHKSGENKDYNKIIDDVNQIGKRILKESRLLSPK